MRVWYRNLDYVSILIWVSLVSIGLIAVYSSTHGPASEYLLDSVRQNFNRQLVWALLCVIGMGISFMLPVRFYQNIAYPLYVLSLILLLAALFGGHEVNGARSWLRIGSVQFQVSEMAKLGTLLAVSMLLSTKRPGTNEFRYGIYLTLLILAPTIIIILQNDTGTALMFLSIVPLLLYWNGIALSHILVLVAPALTAYLSIVYLPAGIIFASVFVIAMLLRKSSPFMLIMSSVTNLGAIIVIKYGLALVLKPHHVARIMSFTNPEAAEYRYSIGFHLVQSKAAIGSGGLWGKGFLQGTQTQGAYVPEQTTDFVYSVIGEEFGFAGAILVLILFGLLLIRLITMGGHIKHPFGNTFTVGVVAFYLAHIFFNIGMTTGILPVIGIPLPFISYGGSALITETAMLAFVLNFYMRRDDFSIYGY